MRMILRRSLLCAFPLLFAFSLAAAGCSTCPEKAAMSKAWKTIGPEYRAYVANDLNLDDFKKGVRVVTCDSLDAMFASSEVK